MTILETQTCREIMFLKRQISPRYSSRKQGILDMKQKYIHVKKEEDIAKISK